MSSSCFIGRSSFPGLAALLIVATLAVSAARAQEAVIETDVGTWVPLDVAMSVPDHFFILNTNTGKVRLCGAANISQATQVDTPVTLQCVTTLPLVKSAPLIAP